MADQPLTIFQVAGRAMSAQLVRMNTTASNLANAGGVASQRGEPPTGRSSRCSAPNIDKASGLATVDVEQIVTPAKRRPSATIPTNPHGRQGRQCLGKRASMRRASWST